MSKYSHYEMCEKIFGSRYKFNDRTGQMEVYTRTDMWNKLVEQHDELAELKTKLTESEKRVEMLVLICKENQQHIELLNKLFNLKGGESE